MAGVATASRRDCRRFPPVVIDLSLESGEVCALTVAPPGCYLPHDARREFGLSAQLYSVRREGDQGIGDFSTLAELARVGAKAGAALIAINPLHALFAQDRTRVSPYYPSDRRFLDPLYIDVAELGRMLGAPIDFDEKTAARSQRRRGCRLSRRACAEDGGARTRLRSLP